MIEFDKVKMSYNGKVGCMCGCNGTYTYASHATGVFPDAEVNDRKVKIAIKKINEAINWDDPADVAEHVNDDHAYMEHNGRTSVVYFK